MKSFKNKALIICSILLSASIVLCSCGSKNESRNSSSFSKSKETKATEYDGKAIGIAENQNTVTGNSSIKESAKKEDKASYTNTQTAALQDRKIVKSSSLVIETKTYNKALEALNEKLKKAGGYIENSNETGRALTDDNSFRNRNAKFVLRIPKQNYEAFITDAGNIGNVINKINSGEDITSQYFDTDAHLKTLRTKEERLLELLKKTGELKDIITLETELNNTRYQIETLTGSLKKWDNMIEYSSVTVEIQEVQKLTEIKETPTTLLGKMINSFIYSCKVVLKIFKGILIAVFAVLPYLPILVILFFVIRFLNKRYKIKSTSDRNNTSNKE